MLYANQPNKGVQQLCQGYNSKVLMGGQIIRQLARTPTSTTPILQTQLRLHQNQRQITQHCISFGSGDAPAVAFSSSQIKMGDEGHCHSQRRLRIQLIRIKQKPLTKLLWPNLLAFLFLQSVRLSLLSKVFKEKKRNPLCSAQLTFNRPSQEIKREEVSQRPSRLTVRTMANCHFFTSHGTSQYKASYVGSQKANSRSVKDEFSHRAQASGYGAFTQKQTKLQESKQITNLVSQVNNKGCDPKDNIQVRRTWLPVRDKALVQANANLQLNKEKNRSTSLAPRRDLQTYKANTNQTLQKDIMTSINIADGMQKIHPVEVGQFRRVRQDVTLQYNKVWSKK